MPEEMVARIDDYRFATRQPSRTAAILTLLEIGLERAGMAKALTDKASKPSAHEGKPLETPTDAQRRMEDRGR
jgi:hypothetical protein